MVISKELFQLAASLSKHEEWSSPELDELTNVANDIGKAWSGSWLGYQSRVYYEAFKAPPAGAAFSQEWGFKDAFSMGTRGSWVEYRFDDVIRIIEKQAGNPNLEGLKEESRSAIEDFEHSKVSALSLVHANFNIDSDKFLHSLISKIEEEKILTEPDFIRINRPTGQFMSRDMIALEGGIVPPPHLVMLAKVFSIKQPFMACGLLKKSLIKLASHIQNLEKRQVTEEKIGTNIFIGHGRSPYWRELKDFVSDRLCLPWDEFNRVPVAGVTNIARLSQMLDQACIALLVMTAEDEQADGDLHARMNVIHEVGLFQGRLGFSRAIVLLEDGCKEFSNIQGLGQIRFPKGKISAIFEDIRQVLEREGIVE